MDITTLSPYALAGATVIVAGALSCEWRGVGGGRKIGWPLRAAPRRRPSPPPPLSPSVTFRTKTHAQKEAAFMMCEGGEGGERRRRASE